MAALNAIGYKATGDRPLARAISTRVISPFCGSIELALIHTDGTGKGLDCVFLLLARQCSSKLSTALARASVEVGLGAKGLAGLDGPDRAKYSKLLVSSYSLCAVIYCARHLIAEL